MSESTSCNLRSNKADHIQVPIQLQLNNDTEFLSQLLQTNNQAQQVTVEESDSSDESDLNCSDIVENSDGEKTGEKETVKSDDVNDTAPDNAAVQQLINSRILSQLQTISHRLGKIEQTRGKKTNDPKKVKSSKNKQLGTDKSKTTSTNQSEISAASKPTQQKILSQNVDQLPQLHTIRQDLLIQAQVEKRLKELAEAGKSGTQKQKSNDTCGTLYKHICTHCFATSGKTFAQPESQCRTNQKKLTKNE